MSTIAGLLSKTARRSGNNAWIQLGLAPPVRQSMAKRHHTIIVIPHAHAKLRKWRVTDLQIGTTIGAVLLLTLTAGFFTWSHFSTKVNPVEIARLETENDQL